MKKILKRLLYRVQRKLGRIFRWLISGDVESIPLDNVDLIFLLLVEILYFLLVFLVVFF